MRSNTLSSSAQEFSFLCRVLILYYENIDISSVDKHNWRQFPMMREKEQRRPCVKTSIRNCLPRL